MTRKITLAVAALLFSGALAAYQKAKIDFRSDLKCASCIRGGWNYCLDITGAANQTLMTTTCEDKNRDPNAMVNPHDPTGVAGSYICSRIFKDQMNAILGGCQPYTNNFKECGAYAIDLRERSDYSVGRSILDLPVGESCTYRVYSTCGYPQASWRVNDEKIAEDFDIMYAAVDGIHGD